MKKIPRARLLKVMLLSWLAIGSAAADVFKCNVNGKIEYRAKACSKGDERSINVPIVVPKTVDYREQALEREKQAEHLRKIEDYRTELAQLQNQMRRHESKLNELNRNREEEISLLKRRISRLGRDDASQPLRQQINAQIEKSSVDYQTEINATVDKLAQARVALKAFLQQPKPEGYEPQKNQTPDFPSQGAGN